MRNHSRMTKRKMLLRLERQAGARSELLNFDTTDIWGQLILGLGAVLVSRMCGSNPGLYPLDARSTPTPQVVTIRKVTSIANVP